MAALDPFSRKRLEHFIEAFRAESGQLPTLADLATQGFDQSKVDAALKAKVIVELYVTLTNGVIKKGFKLYEASLF